MKIIKMSIITVCIIVISGCGKKDVKHTQGEIKNQKVTYEDQKSINQEKCNKEKSSKDKSIPYNKEENCLYIWEERKDYKLLEKKLELAENISLQHHKFEKTDVILVNERTNYPSVVDQKDTPIKRAINQYAEDIITKANEDVTEYIKWAKEELTIRQGTAGTVTKDNFYPYEYAQDFIVTRNDDKMITFVNDIYTFTGGAHPNRYKKVDSFNPKTGELITIDSITKNKEAFYQYVIKSLDEYVVTNNCAEYLFQEEEYREAFKKWDNNWWINHGYLFVGFNTYDIAPYVAGPLVIPVNVDSVKEYLNLYGRSLLES